MSTNILSFITGLMFVASPCLFSQGIPGQASKSDPKIIGPGLTLLRYGTQQSQIKATNSSGYVPHTELLKQKPLRAPKTVYSISSWEKPIGENALVIGYINIEKAGTYSFKTASDWDRNELVIDDKIVCKFRDGEGMGQTVDLRAGLLPIVSVAYVKDTRNVTIKWMPPGETEWVDIPNKLLSRTKVEVPD